MRSVNRGESGRPLLANRTGASGEEPQPMGVYLRYVLGLMRRQIWIVLLSTIVLVGAVGYQMSRQQVRYEATAVLRIADERSELTQGISGMERGVTLAGADPLQTELAILRSRRVIGEAVDRTGFRLQARNNDAAEAAIEEAWVADDAPADSLVLTFRSRGVRAEQGPDVVVVEYGAMVALPYVRFRVMGQPPGMDRAVLDVLTREKAVNWLLGGLTVVPRRQTDVVDVQFTAGHPRVAQRVVNGVVHAFQSVDAEMAQQAARRRREFLAVQVRQTDSLLADLQLELTQLQERARLESGREIVAAQRSALTQLELRQQEHEAQDMMHRELLRRAEAATGNARRAGLSTLLSSPAMASNFVVTRLYEQLMAYEAEKEALLSAGAATTDPDVTRLEQLVGTAEEQLFDAVRSHLEAREAERVRMGAVRDRAERSLAASSVRPQSEVAVAQLQQQLESMRRIGDLLREEFQKARIAEAVEAGIVEIVDLATLPRAPIRTGGRRMVVFAGIVGIMLGMGLGYLRESLDNAIHAGADLEKLAPLPTLVTVPKLELERSKRRLPLLGGGGGTEIKNGDGGQPTWQIDRSRGGVEAYRILCATLSTGDEAESIRTLLVTSALPQEGKSTTAAHLALAHVEIGHRVLLMDCDLIRPTLHRRFDMAGSPGLNDLLKGKCSLQDALRATGVDGLTLMPAGTSPESEPLPLRHNQLRDLIDILSSSYDRIIIDSPPVLGVASATVLARVAEGVVLVTRSGKTDRDAVQQAAAQLDTVGANLLGWVLNDPDGQAERYAYGYYGSYYGAT